MEKYNYDFIADQEPDGNSEWYPAKDADKEIELWRKENEWLLNELLKSSPIEYTKEYFIQKMQQALKGE